MIIMMIIIIIIMIIIKTEAKENKCEDLVNVLQNNVTLSFENAKEMSEEAKIMIKNIIEIAVYNLDENVNRFKTVDRNLSKTGQ